MIRIKISNSKNFAYSEEPTTYDFILKSGKEKLGGKLIIDFQKERISIDLKRKLDYNEKLVVLKEIFYRFCLTSTKLFVKTVNYNVEQFDFVELRSNEKNVSIIDELLQYDISKFNANKNKERVIANIAISVSMINIKLNQGKTNIELQHLMNISFFETEAYKNILEMYMRMKGYNGYLSDATDHESYYYFHTPSYSKYRYVITKKY